MMMFPEWCGLGQSKSPVASLKRKGLQGAPGSAGIRSAYVTSHISFDQRRTHLCKNSDLSESVFLRILVVVEHNNRDRDL